MLSPGVFYEKLRQYTAMKPRVRSRGKAAPCSCVLPLQAFLPVIGGGAVLVLAFLLALMYSVACLVPESIVASPEPSVLSPRQCCIVPVGPEISVFPAMMVSGGDASVLMKQVMQEMEIQVAAETPRGVDFPLLQMELLEDSDGGMPASVLRGVFYDLTRDKSGASAGLVNGKDVQSVVRGILESGNSGMLARFWRFPPLLYSSCFLHPVADAARVSEAFRWQSDYLPSAWVAVYCGRVVAPVSGIIRFVGMGKAYMAVNFDSRIVLESGSCQNSTQKNENPGDLAVGAAIKVTEGESYPVVISISGAENCPHFALLWEHVSEKNVAVEEGVSADVQYYLFRTKLCTPDDSSAEGVENKVRKWSDFNPDSPIWMVVP